MAKYYCPVCEGELLPAGRGGRYIVCPKGHTKLILKAMWGQYAMTPTEREAVEKHLKEVRQQVEEDTKATRDTARRLPWAGVRHKQPKGSRKRDLWVVEGEEGCFVLCGYGMDAECDVRAFSPAHRRVQQGVVALRRVTTEHAARLIFGGKTL